MAVDIRDINPHGLYSLREAATLIPSPYGGTLHARTLQRWLRDGRLKGVMHSGRRYVYGSELLRVLAADQVEPWKGRTPAERKREIEAAERELRRLGVME